MVDAHPHEKADACRTRLVAVPDQFAPESTPAEAEPSKACDPSESMESKAARLEGALHDVANALTVMLGWLDLAEEQSPLETSVARAIRMARQRGLHGRAIAVGAMGHVGRVYEQPQACESFVREAIDSLEQYASRCGVVLHESVDHEAALVGIAEPSCALEVLTNLLLNAIAFTPRGGQVGLRVTCRDAETLRFVVVDEGPGFDPARVAHVFDGIESTRKDGAGIGLRHASWLTQQHGGSLLLLHSGPSSVFELCWSVAKVAVSVAPTPATVKLVGMRVLLLEDDVEVSTLLAIALRARGACVDAVYDWDAARALLEKNVYDVALIDLSPIWPDVEGAVEQVRALSQLKIVLITGSVSSLGSAILRTVSAWVRKPFEVAEIASVLAEIAL